jgi:hypothetical protein
MSNLDLGWSQSYMALKFHMEEAYKEINITVNSTDNPQIAIFSKKYYNDIKNLNNNKIYDYCFIGSINSNPERRIWVVEFFKKFGTKNSIFINTDNNDNWETIGEFDLSKTKKTDTFCPKEQDDNQTKKVQYREINENKFYFETMCQSHFCLCPAGDTSWSFRFYEVLMCGSIPIVESWHHTYRSPDESNINYNYYLFDEKHVFDYQMINSNYELFEKYHLIKN